MNDVIRSVDEILDFIVKEDYKGYDPYDALNSEFIRKIPSKFFKLAFTQVFVYSPLDLRRIFRVLKNENPKGLGLIMRSLCNLKKAGAIEEDVFNLRIEEVHGLLMKFRSKDHTGYSWGYNFPWQDITRFLDRYIPSIVNTSTIANGYLDLYDITGKSDYLDIAKGVCQFILNDLNRFENGNGICFSYTPIDNNVVHNATLMGAEVLCRVASITGNEEYMDLARKTVGFSLAYQREDGSWPYSMNPSKGTERMQIDFHQGFVLDSLLCFKKYGNGLDVDRQILKGADFYFKKQFEDGLTLWRYPRKLPRDAHHQAQGVITSWKMVEAFGGDYREIHQNILKRLFDDFIHGHRVTYQKWFFDNNIQYLRWCHAWTLLALSYSLRTDGKG